MDRQQAFYTAVIPVILALFIPVAYAEASHRRENGNAEKPDHSDKWRGRATLALYVVFALGLTGAFVGIRSESAPSSVEGGVIVCLILLVGGTGVLGLHGIVRVTRRRRDKLIAAFLAAVGAAIGLLLALGLARGHKASLSGPYVITGTCADLTCELRQHTAPSTESSYAGAPLLSDGTLVYIRCQTYGGPAYRHRGHEASLVWDLLKDGRYVTDMFISTRSDGKLDPSIRRCPRI
jgi:hypothetical protein